MSNEECELLFCNTGLANAMMYNTALSKMVLSNEKWESKFWNKKKSCERNQGYDYASALNSSNGEDDNTNCWYICDICYNR